MLFFPFRISDHKPPAGPVLGGRPRSSTRLAQGAGTERVVGVGVGGMVMLMRRARGVVVGMVVIVVVVVVVGLVWL